ncbi:hypothetical protein SAMN05660742_11320 [Propionispira arboris]|uniref:Uncharacterized protein n=1 Tax=Propionispira arboris TaxID=84035 RepID=A0A1H7AMY1_9FIRM|nr:hypothetical protein [Propionispira arboris]SEJ66306.1 hypothetical protein SAMN05660742_11320 [Propionispira arboris]
MEELGKYKQRKTNEKARLANLWQGADAIEKNFLFTTWNGVSRTPIPVIY